MLSWSLQRVARFLLAISREQNEPISDQTSRKPLRAQRRAFDERTRRVIASRPSPSAKLVAGTVQFVGIDTIKAALGNDWLAIANQAHTIAETVIRSHLYEADAFDRQDEDTYILCFAGNDKLDAVRRTARIVDDITRRLKEQVPQASGLRIEHEVTELDWEEVDEEDDTPLIDILAERLRKVRAEAEQSAKQWKRMLIRDATVVYAPVWNVQSRYVSLFRCMLGDTIGKSVVGRIQSLSTTEEMLHTLSELDLVIVSRGVQALHRLVQEGRKAELILPLTFHTLANRRQRDAFLRLCRDIPEAYKSLIHFELHTIPAGVPLPRIVGTIQQLKPLAKSIILQTPMDEQRLRQVSGTGLYGAACDAGWFSQASVNIELYLRRYVSCARAFKLRVFVYGVSTVGLVEAAIRSNVDYVSGEAVAHPLDAPKSAYSLAIGEAWPRHASGHRVTGTR